jgi:hypothetical protein
MKAEQKVADLKKVRATLLEHSTELKVSILIRDLESGEPNALRSLKGILENGTPVDVETIRAMARLANLDYIRRVGLESINQAKRRKWLYRESAEARIPEKYRQGFGLDLMFGDGVARFVYSPEKGYTFRELWEFQPA